MGCITIDLETSIYKSYKRTANPFDNRNRVIMTGYKYDDQEAIGMYFKEEADEILPELDVDLMIGFNIKFDMLYFWEELKFRDFLLKGGEIYDCQYVEYLLDGAARRSHMGNLSDTAVKYGGTAKLDVVKELWKEGVQTIDIPEETLTAYLLGSERDGVEGDIDNTYRVYLGQQVRIDKLANPEAFRAMVKNRMDGLLCTTEMEFNGLYIDLDSSEAIRDKQVKLMEESLEELTKFLPELPEGFVFNWKSNVHKSCVLFGGTAKYSKWLPHLLDGKKCYSKKTVRMPMFGGVVGIGVKSGELYYLKSPTGDVVGKKGRYIKQDCYKSGKRIGEGKFKNVKVDDLTKVKGKINTLTYTFKGVTTPKEEWELASTDAAGNNLYTTNNVVMSEISKSDVEMCKALGVYIKTNKDLGTYFWIDNGKGKKGMLTLCQGNIIHHSINHVNTVTTRLSSSNPNSQNIPRKGNSEVKKLFTSRFKGLMAEIDFKQLEILVQAILTGDDELISGINDGIDFHCKRLALQKGTSYEKQLKLYKAGDPQTVEDRVKAKGFSFQRAFGAGANAIAKTNGMDIDVVKQMIKNEEELYPNITAFDNMLKTHIINNMTGNNHVIVKGAMRTGKESAWQSPFGTIFKWFQEESEYSSSGLDFSPTQRKNYPVQGTGGEIMQTVLGKLYRWWIGKSDEFRANVKLVNTVHDCVVLDGEERFLLPALAEVEDIMTNVHIYYLESFGIDIPVRFKVDTEIGKNLYDMKHWSRK